MKWIVCAICLLITSSVIAADKQPSPSRQPEIGRYQLITGRYKNDDLMNNKSTMEEGLFMIDTVEGVVFICSRETKPNIENGRIESFTSLRACMPFYDSYTLTPEALRKLRQ